LLALGGYNGDKNKSVLEVERYNFEEDKWTIVGRLSRERIEPIIIKVD